MQEQIWAESCNAQRYTSKVMEDAQAQIYLCESLIAMNAMDKAWEKHEDSEATTSEDSSGAENDLDQATEQEPSSFSALSTAMRAFGSLPDSKPFITGQPVCQSML